MYTYSDQIGSFTGSVEIFATSRKNAETVFYKLNQPLILDIINEKPIYNPGGGYLCECVLTYHEWLCEGTPKDLQGG